MQNLPRWTGREPVRSDVISDKAGVKLHGPTLAKDTNVGRSEENFISFFKHGETSVHAQSIVTAMCIRP